MKLRRISAFLLAVLLTAPLSACAPEEEPVIDGEGEPITLSVYYPPFCERRVISMEAILPYACPGVEIERYAVPERVSSPISRMQTEIMAGRGPDVIIDDGTLTRDYNMDVRKMMKAGVFWDMGPSLEADEDFDRSDYFEVILDSGMLDGHQYVMPLDFYMPVLMSTRELLEGHGVNIENCNTLEGLIEESLGALERNEGMRLYNDYRWPLYDSALRYTRDLRADTMMPSYFPNFMDFEAGEVYFDETTEMAMKMWGLDWKRCSGVTREPLRNGDYLTDMVNGRALWCVPCDAQGAITYYGAELEWLGTLMAFPLQNEQKEIGVSVVTYTGILSASKHKKEALQLIKMLFDGTIITSEHATVNKKRYDKYLDACVMGMHSVVRRSPIAVPEGSAWYETIDDSWIEKYRGWVDNITYANLDTLQYNRIFDRFKPYFNGRRSFDQCVADAKNYYSIYVSE